MAGRRLLLKARKTRRNEAVPACLFANTDQRFAGFYPQR